MYPARILVIRSSAKISAVSFLSLLFLTRTKRPSPAPAQSPETQEAKVITPFKYKTVTPTETAQFGIIPKIAAITGCTKLFFSNTTFCKELKLPDEKP